MKRRSFITLLGGAATWPLAAGEQQGDRMRRVGVLMSFAEEEKHVLQDSSTISKGSAGWTATMS